jgi:hypothetical protein
VIVNIGASTAAPNDGELWTTRRLIARHKGAALGVAAILIVMVATILVSVLGSTARPVSDATTCTQWGAANQDQQAAYAKLYVREHGPLRGGKTSPASVIAAINNGCTLAYGDDVSDTATVIQAISGNF